MPEFPHGAGIPTLGYVAVEWAERSLIQPNGPLAGKPLRLMADQVNFLLWAYALDGEAQWLFNHMARRLAKGSGKSPFAAVYALIEFLAPVRLERFDDRELGGVVGRRVDMPLVQIVATAESQTKNTMRFVRAFCPKNGQLARDYQIDVGKTQLFIPPEGTLEQITSSFTAAEGAQTTAAVGDETEHWTPSVAGADLMATVLDNLTKTGGRMMETANAWKPGIGSVAEATFDDWCAQESGLLRGAQRILYDARVAPPDTVMADPVSLREGLEHVFKFCPWVSIDNVMGRIYRKSARVDDSTRKYLNRPSAALDAWVKPEWWALMARPDIEVGASDEVCLFFDGSKSRDATALVGCRLDDGHVFTLGVWQRPLDADDEWTVDVADVDRVVDLTFQTHKVVGFFADVREWESFALTEWPRRYADRLMIEAAPSARPSQAIAWDMRGHAYEFAKAAEAAEAEIQEGAFTHDGNVHTTAHVGNCRRRAYRDAVTVGKESKDSPLKIDAAVCVIGVRMLRRMLLASDEWQKMAKRKARGRSDRRAVVL